MSECSQTEIKHTLPIISVNGQIIDQELFSREIQYHSAENLDTAVQKAGQALVIRQLLKQQMAAELNEVKDSLDEDAFDALITANAIYDPVQPEDCQRYYQQNLEKFKTAPILEVSHILLAAALKDSTGRIKKQQMADELIERLKEQPDLFFEFVAQFSECPSKEMKGSLGQISAGQTVAEFERPLFNLPEGLYFQAIESRYGYHIVLIHKKTEGKQLNFNMVKNQIQQYLSHRRYRQSISDYLYQLTLDADIEGIELKLDQKNIIIS